MYLPRDFAFNPNDRRELAGEMMAILNGFENTPHVKPTTYWMDYYWLVFHKDYITEPEIECFYEKDFTQVKFEELKSYIEDQLKKKDESTTSDTVII